MGEMLVSLFSIISFPINAAQKVNGFRKGKIINVAIQWPQCWHLVPQCPRIAWPVVDIPEGRVSPTGAVPPLSALPRSRGPRGWVPLCRCWHCTLAVQDPSVTGSCWKVS